MVIEHADTHKLHVIKLRDHNMTKCGMVIKNHTWIARPSLAWLESPLVRCGNCDRAF